MKKDPFSTLPPKISEISNEVDPNQGPVQNIVERLRNHPLTGSEYQWVRELEDYPSDPTYVITNVPLEVLKATFTSNELSRIHNDMRWMASWCDEWEKENPVQAKIKSSIWRYGCLNSYRLVTRYLNHLGSLKVEDPGFEVRLTWSSYFNEFGPAVHLRGEKPLYLDGTFGVLVYYKGQHVLTIGIALARCGVLISQVQLREKKGNRWLYHIKRPYLEWAVGIIAEAFKGVKLWLVEGKSTVKAIRQSYGNTPCGMTAETEERISAFYNQPLATMRRTKTKTQYFGREFIKLKRVK